MGTLKIRCRTILGIQKGTIILTTTHVNSCIQNDISKSQGIFLVSTRILGTMLEMLMGTVVHAAFEQVHDSERSSLSTCSSYEL